MEKYIERWTNNGLISKEQALRILEDYKKDKEKNRKTKSLITLYVIGAILLGIGLILFVAANAWILAIFNIDFIKILALASLTFGSFYGGYYLIYEQKKYPRMGSALIILSSFLIGALYALIGQIYNIEAGVTPFFFLWALSIFPVAYAFKERAINLLGVILLVIAMCGANVSILVTGLLLYCIGNIPFIKKEFNDFSLSYKIISLLFIFFYLISVPMFYQSSFETHNIISASILIFVMPLILLMSAANSLFEKNHDDLFKIEQGFLFLFIFVVFLMNLIPSIGIYIISNILLIFIIATGFFFGYKFENLKIINLTTFFLIIFLIYRYCEWGWQYLDKAFFFIFGGIVLIGLGYYLEKQKHKITGKNK